MIVNSSPGARAAVRVSWLLARVGLAILFIVAGAIKLRDPALFATEIANYQLLPAFAPHLAATLPATELVIGAGLLFLRPMRWRRAAVAGALALLVLFTIGVVSAYFRGIDIACGCFGSGGETITILTLLRNAGLLAVAGSLLAFDRPRP